MVWIKLEKGFKQGRKRGWAGITIIVHTTTHGGGIVISQIVIKHKPLNSLLLSFFGFALVAMGNCERGV